jgi:hypothetical protein
MDQLSSGQSAKDNAFVFVFIVNPEVEGTDQLLKRQE